MEKVIFVIKRRAALPKSRESQEVMNDEYKDYVARNGYHFTDEMAEYVSSMMNNADGSTHTWTVEQIKTAFAQNNLAKCEHYTWGDVTFLANHAYAMFYPTVMRNTADCVLYASVVSKSKEGYEGLPFMQFTSDLIGKDKNIEWETF